MHRALLCILMIGVPGLAVAQTSATQTPTSPAAATAPTSPGADAPEAKLICKSTNAVGSRTRKARICMTNAEWRQQSRLAKRDTADLQGRSVPKLDREIELSVRGN